MNFSVPKTVLIHWRTLLQRDPLRTPRPPPVALDSLIFHLSEKLQWLDYSFVSNIASSAHFSLQLVLSQAAFSSVRRLSDSGQGISPHLCHRLAYCLMFSILSYCTDLFSRTKGLGPMAAGIKVGHRLLPHHSRANPCRSVVPVSTLGSPPA